MQIKMHNSDIIWSYLGSFFQYCTSLIVLPLVLSNVSKAELGLWYTFASVGTLVTYLDFGFSTTLIRNITYAWSGAKKIQAVGFNENDVDKKTDIVFVHKILTSCRLICLLVALLALLVLGSAGTLYIKCITKDFSGNSHIIAWLIYATAIFLNLYYNYCGNALKGIGEISAYQKIIVISRSVQIFISFVGIKMGYGLIALSVAYLVSGFVIRFLSNYKLNRKVSQVATDQNVKFTMTLKDSIEDTKNIFKDIWHNAKRTGIISLCSYATNQSLTLICSVYLGVEETASYGLCLQLITAMLSVAGIMFGTAQPQMINQMVTGKHDEFRKTFSMGIFIFWVISICGMILFGIVSTPLLAMIGSNTKIPFSMYTFMCIYMFLEHNHGEYTAYFTMKNTIIYMVPYIISSILIAALSFFVAIWGGNIYCLMFVHFIVQIIYNNWKWPKEAMNMMHTNIKRTIKEGYHESFVLITKILKIKK